MVDPRTYTFIRRLIPVTAVITAASCLSDEKKLDNDRVTKFDAKSYCERFRECDPAAFEASFRRFRDCVDEQLDRVRGDVLGEALFGGACTGGYESYFECRLRSYACEDGSFVLDSDCERSYSGGLCY